MKEGDVVLARMQQADRRAKNRPAVVLRELPPYRDVLICGVSSQLNLHVPSFDEVIGPEDGDFVTSGLLTKSLLRLGFLAVVPRKTVMGSVGAISPERHRRLLGKLASYLVANLDSQTG